MNGHTHLAGGLLAGLTLSALLHPHATGLLSASAALAGPLADVDHPASLYGRLVPLPGVVLRHGRVEGFSPYLSFSDTAKGGRPGRELPGGRILWHRGETHSIFAAALAGVLCGSGAALLWGGAPGATVAAGVFVGYLSHLALDLLNVSPISFLWPFSRRPIHLKRPRIRVGSLEEHGVFVLLLLVLWALGRGVVL